MTHAELLDDLDHCLADIDGLAIHFSMPDAVRHLARVTQRVRQLRTEVESAAKSERGQLWFRGAFQGEIMKEVVLELSPEHLMNMADQIEADPRLTTLDPLREASVQELRDAAAAIKRGERYSVIRPEYTVTWAPKSNA